MSDEIDKETEENPEVEETPEPEKVEENPPEEKDTPKKETEGPKEKSEDEEKYTDRERRYYARMKEAEEQAKKAKELAKSKRPVSDIDAILEVQEATKNLDHDEVAELKVRAVAKNISLSDARNDENFILWQKAYSEKVAKEKKTPEPSSAFATGKSTKDIKKMSDEEFQTFEEKYSRKQRGKME